jgi:hypothetical protein
MSSATNLEKRMLEVPVQSAGNARILGRAIDKVFYIPLTGKTKQKTGGAKER